MSEFRVGERYRLGLVQSKGELVRDDWTGLVVRIEQHWGGELWRCHREAESDWVIVSVERLRASARLGDLRG